MLLFFNIQYSCLIQKGDTIGVVRKDMGILHFFVNGVDQGPAAFNVPEHVFGIIGKYFHSVVKHT